MHLRIVKPTTIRRCQLDEGKTTNDESTSDKGQSLRLSSFLLLFLSV